MYDVIIVGGGPAGLSAALILGRCRRRVLLCDGGHPRNAAARQLNGYLTRDGIAPAELLHLGREEIARYPSIEFQQVEVVEATCRDQSFSVTLAGGDTRASRMLLLATGVVDELPELEGLDQFYGYSVFHCPYCDGWEVRDQPVAMYKPQANSVESTLELLVWTSDVVLCTDGPARLGADERDRLKRHGVGLCEKRIARLEGEASQLRRIVLADGSTLERTAMFFSTGFRQHSELATSLGCNLIDPPVVNTGRKQSTNIPGLFVAGDAGREAQLAIIAAAEGAKAAFAINAALAAADAA